MHRFLLLINLLLLMSCKTDEIKDMSEIINNDYTEEFERLELLNLDTCIYEDLSFMDSIVLNEINKLDKESRVFIDTISPDIYTKVLYCNIALWLKSQNRAYKPDSVFVYFVKIGANSMEKSEFFY